MTHLTSAPQPSTKTWLKAFSTKFRRYQAVVLMVRVIQFITQVIGFWLFAHLIHTVAVVQSVPTTNDIIQLMFVLAIWVSCMGFSDHLRLRLKHRVEEQLEKQLHDVLSVQQIALTRRYSSAYWQQLFLTHIEDIGDYLTQYTVQKWLSAITPIIVLIVILPIHYVVGIALLVSMPTVPLFMILVGSGAAVLHRKHFIALERLGDMFSDRLKALSLVTVSGQHDQQFERLKQASELVNQKTMKVVSVAFLSTTVLDFFSTVSIALVAVFIGFSLLGEINIGPIITLHTGLFMLLVTPLLFGELRTLGRFYHQQAKAQAGAERLSEVLAPVSGGIERTKFIGINWLKFKVSSPSLQATKLQLQPKDWVLLKGNSGEGKTILLEALMGFRQASHTLNGDVALMSQQACVLNDTVAFNLNLGHHKATQESITSDNMEKILNEVGLSGWLLALPNGLSSKLEDCPALSGGEAQRLALARVLLQQKEVVLLDEPTAHLSHGQHVEIAQLIQTKLHDKTVIWASHKPLKQEWFNQLWTVKNSTIFTSREENL